MTAPNAAPCMPKYFAHKGIVNTAITALTKVSLVKIRLAPKGSNIVENAKIFTGTIHMYIPKIDALAS